MLNVIHTASPVDAGDALTDAPATPAARKQKRSWLPVVVALWLGLVGLGLHQRFVHAMTPGTSGATPSAFPSASPLAPPPGQSTLLMFVHPECPCTRASLHELAGLLAAKPAGLSAVLVVAPTLAAGRRWEDTTVAAMARSIPNLAVFADRDAAEATRFGAGTSGYTVLYDAHGRLSYAGGITGSRGHVGDNLGLQTVRSLIQQQATPTANHAVFGCPLSDTRPAEERGR